MRDFKLKIAGTAGVFVTTVLALCSACGDGDDPMPGMDVTAPGSIVHYNRSTNVIDAPAVTELGSELVITVRTYGGDCVSFGRTDVSWGEAEVVVRPFDVTYVPGDNEPGCLTFLSRIEHPVRGSFDSPGEKLIRVEGQKVAATITIPWEITSTITVR